MKIFSALFSQKTPVKMNIRTRPDPVTDYLADSLRSARDADSLGDLEEGCRHYSGYVREAAIRRCIDLAWPESLSLVVDRLNDWVRQVRDLARRALMILLPLASPSQIVSVLPDILRLHGAGRGDYSEWLNQFERALIQTVSAAEFVAAAQGTDINVARACVQILDKHKLIEATALIDLILSRNDDIVLAQHAAELCAVLPPEQQAEWYRAAAMSHFGSVRTTAIRALLTMENESRMEIALDALSDVQSSVRSVAMSYLALLGLDLRAHFRTMLEQRRDVTKRVRIALFSLASLRNKDDIELVKSFLSSERISIRLAALASWFKLDEHDKDLIASRALADAAPGVRRFALQLTRKHGAYIPIEAIQQRLEEIADVALLLRFAESKKWVWLECIARLSLQRSVEASIKLGLDRSLKEWIQTSGRGYEQPNAEQIVFLSSEIVILRLAELLGNAPSRAPDLRKMLAHQGLTGASAS